MGGRGGSSGVSVGGTVTSLGKDEKKLISSGNYNIQASGGYADRQRQYVSIQNLKTEQTVAERVGNIPSVSKINESIQYQTRLKNASEWAAKEYAKDAKNASSVGAKRLFNERKSFYEQNAKNAENMIEWLKKRKK